jgi:Kef-type K+ transport system membrane component KefB
MSMFLLAAGEGAALPEGAVVLKELTTEHNIAWVIIDVVIILVVARLVGALFRRIGQPPVVGEILAGLIMGPLVLGSGTVTDLLGLDESISDTLFPTDARPFLKVLAELGLVIFMFVVGLELDMKLIKGKERLAAGVSLTSVLLPFSLGFGLAAILRDDYLPEGIDFLPFALFIGASMSVTAFPVLARILNERRMTGTPVGAVSLACAAIDDILAWSLLALVTAVIESTSGGGGNPGADLARVMGLTIAFGIFMSVAIKPVLSRLNDRFKVHGLTPDLLAAVLGLLLVASWATSHIGIHSIFGAFMLGVVFPRAGAEEFTHAVLEKIESVAVLLLLPLFFIVTGLNAKIPSGVDVAEFLKVLAMILVVACVGKFVGATVAGRLQGMSWRRSAAVGTLMNTRGLTELVLLSIGLDKGVLDETMFTALVLMAIITTVMTSPLLQRIYPDRMIEHDIAEAERAALGDAIAFRLLVAIDDPTRAEPLVDLACGIARSQLPAEVVLTNFEEQPDDTGRELSSLLDTIAGELDTMHGLEERVRAQGLAVQSFSQRTTSLAADIAAQAQRMGARLVVVGDRRDDPAWVATVGELVALGPADVGVVVAPLPRAAGLAKTPDGPPVVEVGDGPAGIAALEYGVRLALPAGGAPTIVGLGAAGRGAKRFGAVLERLRGLGHAARTEDAGLGTPEGAAVAEGAMAVVRPFAGPEGLQPVERARPDAERFGVPVLLVAPDPNQLERSGLDSLLAAAESAPEPVD